MLKVEDYVNMPGHSIDIAIKAYPTCIGLCRPTGKIVMLIRKVT